MRPAAWIPLVLVLATGGCGEKSPSKPAKPAESVEQKSSGNPLTAPVDYLGAVGAAQKSAARFADLNPVQQAVRAFQAGEDRLPGTLEELVSEGYLPRLPIAPAGSRLAYNPQTGQVRFVPAQ